MKIANQYFREEGGNRVKVNEWEWAEDKVKHNYRQIHAYGVCVVYRMI